MLRRYVLTLTGIPENRLKYELAVKIHGYLNHVISGEDASRFHAYGESRPYSMFLTRQKGKTLLVINTLNEQAACIPEALSRNETISIDGLRDPVIVQSIKKVQEETLETLEKGKNTDIITLHFFSPVTYRKNNRFCCRFDLSRISGNPLAKLKAYEGIDIPKANFYQWEDSVRFQAYHLRSYRYRVTKEGINSFLGRITLNLEDCPETLKTQFHLALRYARYTGAGSKTTLGMGGMDIVNAL